MVDIVKLPTMYGTARYNPDTQRVDVFLSASLNSCVDKARNEWPDAQIYIYKPTLMTGDIPDDSANRIDQSTAQS